MYLWELQLTLGLRSYSTDKLRDKFRSKYCVDAYSAILFYSISGKIDYVNAFILKITKYCVSAYSAMKISYFLLNVG